MNKAEKKEMRDLAGLLDRYKEQLLARHKSEPLKSPPLFILTSVIIKLESLGDES